MKPRFAFGILFALCACAPLSIYHRAGVSVAQMQRDTTDCEVQALRAAPVANSIRRGPARFVPGPRICDAAGTCWRGADVLIPGEIYTVDVNKGLRDRVTLQCMGDKGYAPAQVPVCPAGVRSAAPKGTTTILPPLSERSCVIRNDDGSFQIVTRG